MPAIYVNVADHGAIGDGIHPNEDTRGFEAAIQAASQLPPGATVLVPPGSYNLIRPIDLHHMALLGSVSGAWNTDEAVVPELNFNDMPINQAAIIMRDMASVHGLYINRFRSATDIQVNAGPAIQLVGRQPVISNLKIDHVWDGIITDNTGGPGRLQIQNVFMRHVPSVGVQLDGMADFGSIDNVEVWNPGDEIGHLPGDRIAFRFRRVDGLRATRLSSLNARVGIHLQSDDFWGEIAAFTCDKAGTAIDIERARFAMITGGVLRCHHFGVRIAAREANVGIHGTYCECNSDRIIECGHVGVLSITGLTGRCPKPLVFTDADIVNINGCSLLAPGIERGAGVHNWNESGNVLG